MVCPIHNQPHPHVANQTTTHAARQTRRPRHARGLVGRLPLLHHLDSIDGNPPSPTSPFVYSSRLTHPAFLSPEKQPFVDSDHPLQNFFPPRVWAVRIPVILVLLGCAVVGSFLSVVMIRSNRKKAAKAKAAAAKKKA